MRKRLVALALACMMTVSATGCSKSDHDSKQSNKVGGSLIIGQVTDLTGDFAMGWANGAADADIKYLINAYSPTVYTREGTYEVDPVVVKKYDATENADGTKTYTFTLNEDLVYNNGLQITADDYIFSLLKGSSPEFEALGAYATDGEAFVGYDDFYSGKTKTFSGIRKLGDYEFSITVKADRLPYFYELAWFAVTPQPMSVYAPGVTLTDDGNGATLSDNYTTDVIEEPVNSERFNPTVTSGPYKLDSYDNTSKQAVLVINDKYNGTYDGVKPSIEKLIFKKVQQATMMDELAAGSVDLITQVSGGTLINSGLDLYDQGKADYVTYLRNGYGKLVYVCDFGPTQFVAVRQAIAYCLDRNEFAAQYSGGYAQVVNGYYGLGQWEYQKKKSEIDSQLNSYTFDLEKAEQTLIEDGWTYNKSGAEFQKGVDDVRYKKVDGELMPLEIQWGMVDNDVSQLLATMLPDNAASVGMKITATSIDFSVLLNNLSREGIDKPFYHMFNMGVTFSRTNDPSYYYNTDKKYDQYNNNKIYDDELCKVATELKLTDSSDKDAYADKWLTFEKRWNELMPDLPLYSDEYHEFFNSKLKNYETNASWSAREQLVYCYVEE